MKSLGSGQASKDSMHTRMARIQGELEAVYVVTMQERPPHHTAALLKETIELLRILRSTGECVEHDPPTNGGVDFP